ncbi:MAG TPA: NeuD/PglB/VioB family sugar acetyltransferase [Kofleriaceae bacterium]|nr:NeuD/PglB/VioB family sugar acetyltransferase [Kofleriaceae bacterium]
MSRIVVVGAGGHAKVVIATARAAGHEIASVLDDDRARWAKEIAGVVVAGPIEQVLADRDALCVLAIGDNATRRRLADAARCRFASLIHPSAVVDDSVSLGEGTVIFAGAIVQPDARIGAHSIVNTAASIDHDCDLGIAVHCAPGARLAGSVRVGEEALVGIGAVVVPGVRIGARAIVAAGAVVVRDVAIGATVVGVPARPLESR